MKNNEPKDRYGFPLHQEKHKQIDPKDLLKSWDPRTFKYMGN